QPLEPAKLEAEFLASHRIAVRRVKAGDQEAVDGGLDVAARQVVLVARKRAAGLDDPLAARQNGDPVPAFLTARDRLVAGCANGAQGKGLRLQLLQADDVGRRLFKPAEKNGQPAVD